MLRLPLTAAVVLSATAATLPSAQENTPVAQGGSRTFAPVTDIEWSSAAQAGDEHRQSSLRFNRDGMNTTMGADELPEANAALADVSSAAPGEPVSFSVAREAGAIACAGRVTAPGRATGTCRFDPDQSFLAALSARGVVPEDVEELVGLAFVGARLASVDDLSRAGFTVADADELITVAALEVTGAYATALRNAGLQPEDLDELVSAKAVGVDPGWIAEMAQAGYPDLDLDKAIELCALGVTPDYARRMARVMRAMDGVEQP